MVIAGLVAEGVGVALKKNSRSSPVLDEPTVIAISALAGSLLTAVGAVGVKWIREKYSGKAKIMDAERKSQEGERDAAIRAYQSQLNRMELVIDRLSKDERECQEKYLALATELAVTKQELHNLSIQVRDLRMQVAGSETALTTAALNSLLDAVVVIDAKGAIVN